ncbi:hypothetical protein LIER_34975 [Lithospermum erythrorhizon]|uniref:Uncharacterized protein n=1 Tax=Lithospermum erythrorhizon TaxID=34254 RepID=A0AAV3NIM1_LITER
MSRPRVSMPVESSQHQSSHADDATDPFDDEGLSGEDVDATTSDIVPESSSRDQYEIRGGTIEWARHLWEAENQKKWHDLLTKRKSNAMHDHGVDDVALLPGTPMRIWPCFASSTRRMQTPYSSVEKKFWTQTELARAGLGKG